MEQYAAVQWKQTNEIKTEQHRRRKKKQFQTRKVN